MGKKRSEKFQFFFVVPALLLSMLVVLVPAVLTVFISFSDWDGFSMPVFRGLVNYRAIFQNPDFWSALYHNIQWMVLFLTIPVIIALCLSWNLYKLRRSQVVYQVIFLVPYVMSSIINTRVWATMIYNPLTGFLKVLNNVGLELTNPMGNTGSALYAVAAVDMWSFWGFLTVMYLSAMKQTPYEQIEAAHIEGASNYHIFRYIVFPTISHTIILMMLLITIWSFLTFDYVYLLTQGGPAGATEMLSTLSYKFAFTTFEVGKAAATAIVMSFFGMLASFAYIAANRRGVQ